MRCSYGFSLLGEGEEAHRFIFRDRLRRQLYVRKGELRQHFGGAAVITELELSASWPPGWLSPLFVKRRCEPKTLCAALPRAVTGQALCRQTHCFANRIADDFLASICGINGAEDLLVRGLR